MHICSSICYDDGCRFISFGRRLQICVDPSQCCHRALAQWYLHFLSRPSCQADPLPLALSFFSVRLPTCSPTFWSVQSTKCGSHQGECHDLISILFGLSHERYDMRRRCKRCPPARRSQHVTSVSHDAFVLRTKKNAEREGGKRKSLSLLHIFLVFHEMI